MKYQVQIFCFDGEASQDLCQCEDRSIAILIAKQLDKYGHFEGVEFLTDKNLKWQLRVIEYDENSHVDVIWENGKELK